MCCPGARGDLVSCFSSMNSSVRLRHNVACYGAFALPSDRLPQSRSRSECWRGTFVILNNGVRLLYNTTTQQSKHGFYLGVNSFAFDPTNTTTSATITEPPLITCRTSPPSPSAPRSAPSSPAFRSALRCSRRTLQSEAEASGTSRAGEG